MAASKEEKQQYDEAIREPKARMKELEKEIKDILVKKKKSPAIAGYYNLEMVLFHLDIIMLNINMNDSSIEFLDLRNSAFLERGRKEFYKALQLLEEIAGTELEKPLSENKEYLKSIEQVSIRNILHLVRKFSWVFETLKDRVGSTSKWKWAFVDIYVRVAAVIKNMINFTELEQYRNFRSEYFKDREEILKFCKTNLEEAAKESRNKYEMSTKAPEDIRKALELLSSLHNIHVLYGEVNEAQKTKTVIDALRTRVDTEEKKVTKDKAKLAK
ncbi:MAG: hypothetical protein PF637_08235 [Spirochaetes bacterium]|jgi:hypothetical protein|nr:hypothetical protein [Spirochaetota bacterium]